VTELASNVVSKIARTRDGSVPLNNLQNAITADRTAIDTASRRRAKEHQRYSGGIIDNARAHQV